MVSHALYGTVLIPVDGLAVVDGVVHCDVALERDAHGHEDGGGHGDGEEGEQEVREQDEVQLRRQLRGRGTESVSVSHCEIEACSQEYGLGVYDKRVDLNCNISLT